MKNIIRAALMFNVLIIGGGAKSLLAWL